jgi:hypothetical protein
LWCLVCESPQLRIQWTFHTFQKNGLWGSLITQISVKSSCLHPIFWTSSFHTHTLLFSFSDNHPRSQEILLYPGQYEMLKLSI